MQTLLLTELLGIAEGIKRDNKPFDVDKWFTYDGNGAQIAADLGGYASEHPTFNQLGLRKFIIFDGTKKIPVYAEPQFGPPKGYFEVGFGALAAFFGLTEQQSYYLFGFKDDHVTALGGEPDFTIDGVITRLKDLLDADPNDGDNGELVRHGNDTDASQ